MTGQMQFVYLLPGDPALECPRLDHFGLEVSTVEEIEEIVAKAKAWQEKDDRVQIIDVEGALVGGPARRLRAHERVHRIPPADDGRAAAPARRPRVSPAARCRARSRTSSHRSSRPIPTGRRWSPGRAGGRTPSSTGSPTRPRTRSPALGVRPAIGSRARCPTTSTSSSRSTARCASARCGWGSTAPWRRRRSSSCSTTAARRCCCATPRPRSRCQASAARVVTVEDGAGGVARRARSRARRAARRRRRPVRTGRASRTPAAPPATRRARCTASTTCSCPAPCSARAGAGDRRCARATSSRSRSSTCRCSPR